MIAVGHTSVGTLVGLAAGAVLPARMPLAAKCAITLGVAVGSHYVMDLVPHGHYNFDSEQPTRRSVFLLFIDLILPVLAILGILFIHGGLNGQWWLAAAGIAGAQAPDVFTGLVARGIVPKLSWVRKEQAFHQWTHWHNPLDLAKATNEGGRKLTISDIWQLAMVFFAIWGCLFWAH